MQSPLPVRGNTGGAVTPVPVPASTGGEALPIAIESLQNLRTLKLGVGGARPLDKNRENSVPLPDIGYAKAYRIYVRGNLQVALGTGSVTLGDPRRLFRSLGFNVLTSTRIHELPGLELNLLNQIEFPTTPGSQRFTANAGANPFELEFVIFLPFSEAKASGIIYKGGGSTYSTIRAIVADESAMLTAAGGATAVLNELTWDIREERIDYPAPVSPEATTVYVDGQPQTRWTQGEGLWRETSQFIETVTDQEVLVAGANREIRIPMEISKPYLRLMLAFYNNGVLDSVDAMFSRYRIEFEGSTTMWDQPIYDIDREFREMYKRVRPGGFIPISFRDKVPTDRDTLYTENLGSFDLILYTGPNAPITPNPNTFVRIFVQRVKELTKAGRY